MKKRRPINAEIGGRSVQVWIDGRIKIEPGAHVRYRIWKRGHDTPWSEGIVRRCDADTVWIERFEE